MTSTNNIDDLDGVGVADADDAFKLAPFNPSSEQIQQKTMELLVERITVEQQQQQSIYSPVLFDLGCGDARLLIACAKNYPTLKCVGVEIDAKFARRAMETIQELAPEVQERICVHHGDALKVPMPTTNTKDNDDSDQLVSELTLIDDASAIYLFVLPKGIEKLLPILQAVVEKRKQERRSFRILSYMFKIHEWEPSIIDKTSKGGCPVYLYEFLH